MKPEMTALNPPERTRTYFFPEGQTVQIPGITHIAVSSSGTHRLKTSDGKLHIVPVGWLHIEIDADDWTL
jgi:hypothetical protein